jgi:hypothetical protein
MGSSATPARLRNKTLEDLPSWFRPKFEKEIEAGNFTAGDSAKSLLISDYDADEITEVIAACFSRAGYSFFRADMWEVIQRATAKPLPFDDPQNMEDFEDTDCYIIPDLFSEAAAARLQGSDVSTILWFLREVIDRGRCVVAPCDYKDVMCGIDGLGDDAASFFVKHFERIENEQATSKNTKTTRSKRELRRAATTRGDHN